MFLCQVGAGILWWFNRLWIPRVVAGWACWSSHCHGAVLEAWQRLRSRMWWSESQPSSVIHEFLRQAALGQASKTSPFPHTCYLWRFLNPHYNCLVLNKCLIKEECCLRGLDRFRDLSSRTSRDAGPLFHCPTCSYSIGAWSPEVNACPESYQSQFAVYTFDI